MNHHHVSLLLPQQVVLVTEFLSGGELFERVSSEHFTLTEAECTQFVSQICQGVEYLHKKEWRTKTRLADSEPR